MSRPVEVEDKVGQWLRAYRAVAAELTPDALRTNMDAVINVPLSQDPEGIIVFLDRMNASLGLARLISANDRAAGTIAAMLVATGIKPTAINYGDDT